MIISELALGLFTNLLYESFKNIPEYISDTSSKVYNKAIEEFSNKNYKLTGVQIDIFFRQENVEKEIEKYLKNPNRLDCSNILIHEFFELFSEEDFSREDADLILNSFFEIIDAEIEKEPELRDYLILNFVKRTDKTTQEINQGVKDLSQDVKEISHKVQEMHEVINGGRENQDKKESGVNFEESLEKYLNKIIDEDGKNGISEVYTELSAKEIFPVTLKSYDKERDKPQEFEILELIEKEEKLIVSGKSGSGKTSTLKWLNFIHATDYLEKKEGIIPLYVELNTYIEGSFYDYVKIKANRKGISEEILKTILKGKAIILIDGLDLLSSNNDFRPYHQISNFVSTYSNCRFVISSRPGFFESIESDFKVSELEKLTDEKIKEFIDKYVSDREFGKTIKNKILNDQHLKSLLTTPMMLHLAIEVAMERKGNMEELFPSNRYEMYEAFVSGLFTHYGTKNGKIHCAERSQIETVLTSLYFELQCRKAFSCKYEKAKEIIEEDILEKCFKLGLLVENDSEIKYGVHQSFQEYFAAIKLKELFESGYDISEAFSHPKWEEVVIFTSEMLDSDLLNEYIDLIISKGELFLASKCANKASDNTKEKLCALLADKMDSKYNLEKMNSIISIRRIENFGISIIIEALKDEDANVSGTAAWALENIKSDTVVNLLIKALNDQDSNVRENAAWILGNIKSDKAVQPLIKALKDENSYVRMHAAWALRDVKLDTAVQSLINALKDEDSNVQIHATRALENIKSDTTVQLLIKTLNDDSPRVRLYVIHALGNIKSDKAIQPLINTLKDENLYMRQRVAEALGKIKSDKAIQLLINALKDENSYVRKGVAEALGYIKSDKAVEPLINALKDEDANVREIAANALGNIKPEIAVQPLTDALRDGNSDVRKSVAHALGNIKSNKAVDPLINTLKKDEDTNVREMAAEALGNIKSENAVQTLINALNDENSYVRVSAAKALGNIKSDTAVQPLINALKDEDANVRRSTVEALGNTKCDKVVNPLIDALKDKDSIVRKNALKALEYIKSDTITQLLINALKDKHIELQLYAAQALGNIKSDKAIDPLINTLKDENSYVRVSAAKALGNIKSDTAVQPLINTLKKDEDANVRMSAAKALGNIKSDTAVQPLINALKDEDANVRENAAKALGEICTVKDKKPLEDLLKSDHEFSANTAFEILYEIGKEEKSKLILFKELKKRSEIIPKYSIFVSSVQKELENERVTIQNLVESDPFLLAHYASLLYEYEPAYPEKTLDGCLNALNSCQVYLLIVGVKYGTLLGEISITHTEYRYAKEKNLPIFIFIKGERNIEREQGTQALLREIDSDDFKYKRFRNVIELKNEVSESLKKLLQDEGKFLKT
ncbi:HEAT repeat domain-containing protein [Methanosarcina sp.]|uniref:HEAT repeat domain-containing protein n=1 Tax=Methanosarcina sp. TaxID=2213 RepID=UPI00298885A8|nr:HEAT repeat domain-containing protein [Methanosarcina sp.]MDW5548714.1 HEAT repeat domain-containing protein [Methanosarcina sp.]MDW5553821.1 HEAT repeat domain-containing protein [Methanosarcina sp.]MDW5558853.1 HEAT repeat domain-containing protein [Methanosarcina sp.]